MLNMGEKNNTLVYRPVQVNSTRFYNLNFTNNNLRVTYTNIFLIVYFILKLEPLSE